MNKTTFSASVEPIESDAGGAYLVTVNCLRDKRRVLAEDLNAVGAQIARALDDWTRENTEAAALEASRKTVTHGVIEG